MKKIILLLLFLSGFQMQSQCWQKLSGGLYNTFGIKTDGTMWSWGDNLHGMLGLGIGPDEMSATYAPTQIGTDNDWQMVSAGKGLGHHAAAIKSNGTLWVWGDNDQGQLGDGSYIEKYAPTQLGTDTNWKEVRCGANFMLAIKTDGTLWSCGYNGSLGLLANGGIDTNVLTQAGTDSDWDKITAGQNNGFAIKTNGTLWAWGSNGFGAMGIGVNYGVYSTPTQVGTETDWATVDYDGMSGMALKTNGTLWTWGYNDDGQLGNGNYDFSVSPVQIGGNDWQSIAAEAASCFAIKTDGTLWTWGSNYYQQLGTGTGEPNDNVPVQLGGDKWASVFTGNVHCFALKEDGEFWGWGNNYQGQLGTPPYSQYVTVPMLISAGCLLGNDGFSSDAFTIYPNPANDILHFQNPDNLTINKIFITDMLGKRVMEVNENTNEINVQQLSQGVYILEILSEGKSYLNKFIKQ
jgi:alpha-tubulin suppressor-like RCC1 family protein